MGIFGEIKQVSKEFKALTGDTFAKGDLFEDLINRLLPEDEFTVVYATTRRDDLGGRRIESAMNPDFKIRHRRSGHMFWVECKYRSSTYGDKIQWCEQWQLDRYNKFQESVRPEKVYIAIGLAGRASNPEHLYCIPLNDAKYPGLYPSTLKPYEHDQNRPFVYSYGKLL